ncbi:HlyC/CorC family transporter [Pontibacter sp. BT310]|uniref:Hemolysin family protein n=1 Tax=Pontibacter populi TaxID=890055 RepID=A0ABS6X833_9BACT|nr:MULTISPECIES: hemolysin family protein [Pontibacter]MBJ6117303.1 HlyC/CorC family transporter [Pontibacter sp. BT310]MBR0569728.1 HlyC/CorC family transporter [Microvirga sp. STS03]MBW3364156.1 hemolysin family protein [Pontibacter populi]
MEIIIILILTLLNGFFALSEIALVSVKRSRIEQKAAQGSSSAKDVLKLLDEPENFLSSVQVGITLISIVAGAYGGAALSEKFTPVVASIPALAPYALEISIVVTVGLITYVTIVIGELIPKTIALNNPERIALAVAPTIKVFTKFTFPLVKLLSGSTNLAIKLLGIKQDQARASLTEEELRHLIKVAGREGVLEKEEERLHDNLFYLYEQRNRSLMTYRTDVEWLDINRPLPELHQIILQSAHTKFPVGKGSLDNIVGVLAVKDYFEQVDKQGVALQAVLKPPLFVSESMYAMKTLKMFQRKKQYLALVVNEFGAVEGLLTLHDIMEAIVGDLPDVDESSDPELFRREDGSYLVNGAMLVRELNRELGLELIQEQSERYATLGGFILYTLSKIPRVGDKITLRTHELEVVDMDASRVDKVLVRTIAPLPEETT